VVFRADQKDARHTPRPDGCSAREEVQAAGSSGTSLEDESPVSVFSTCFPDTDSPCGKG